MADLQSKLSESEEQSSLQQEEIDSLTAKLRVAMSELSHLEQALQESGQELRSERELSHRALEELEARIDELEKDVRTKEHQLQCSQQQLQLSQDRLIGMESRAERVDSMETQVKRLLDDLTEREHLVQDLTHEAELLRKQLRGQDEEKHKAQREHKTRIKEMEGEFYLEKEKLGNTISQLQLRLEQAAKQTGMAESLSSNMTDIMREKDDTIAQLEEKVIENESRIDELTDDLNLEIEDNTKLHHLVDDGNKAKEELQEKIHTLEVDIQQLQQRATEESKDKGEKSSLKKIESLQSDLREAERSNTDLSLTITEQQTKLSEWSEKWNRQVASLARVEDALSHSNKERDQEKAHSAELAKKLDDMTLDLQSSQSQYTASQIKLKQLQEQYCQAELQSEEAKLASQKLRKEKDQQEVLNKQQLETLQSEAVKAWKEKCQSLEVKLQDITTQLESQKYQQEQVHKVDITAQQVASQQEGDQLDPMSYRDIPATYDELRKRHQDLLTNFRLLKKQLQTAEVSSSQLESINMTLKQEVKNTESAYQEQLQQLTTKVSDLTNKLEAADRRNKRKSRGTLEALMPVDAETQTTSVISQGAEPTELKLQEAEGKVKQLMRMLNDQNDLQMDIRSLKQTIHDQQLLIDRMEDIDILVEKDRIRSSFLQEIQTKTNEVERNLHVCVEKIIGLARGVDQVPGSQVQDQLQCVADSLQDCLHLLPGVDSVQQSVGEVDLQIFSDRLALESVILAQMATLVKQEKEDHQEDQWEMLRNRNHILAAETSLVQLEQSAQAKLSESLDYSALSTNSSHQLTKYASLLSEHMGAQYELLNRLTEVKPSEKSSTDGIPLGEHWTNKEAVLALAHSHLDQKLPPTGVFPSGESLSPVLAHIRLAKLLASVQANSPYGKDSSDSDTEYARNRIMQQYNQLQPTVAAAVGKMVSEVGHLYLGCEQCRHSAQGMTPDMVYSQLRYVTNNYYTVLCAASVESKLSECVQSQIDKELEDVQNSIGEWHKEHSADSTNCPYLDWELSKLQSKRTSCLLGLADLIVRKTVSQGYVENLDLATATSSSLAGSRQLRQDLASVLVQQASVRRDVSAFLANNTATLSSHPEDQDSVMEHIARIASRLAKLDQLIQPASICRPSTVEEFQALVEQQAVSQAQLTYVVSRLRLQHKAELKQLQNQLEQSEQQAESQIASLQDQLEQQAGQDPEDLSAELERKESNFRREVQALKDGYEIRIRSLQADLQGAQKDLDHLHQEKEQDMSRYERQVQRLEQELLQHEEILDKLQTERESESVAYETRVTELETQLGKVDGVGVDSIDGDRMTTPPLETGGDRISTLETQVLSLKQQLEEEKTKHMVRDR